MDFLFKTHRVGKVFAVEIRIAYSLYVVMGVFFLQFIAFNPPIAASILFLPLSVILHELAHAQTARRYRVDTEVIALHALGGTSQIYGRIPSPRAELFIAAAGPAANLALGGALLLLTNNAWLSSTLLTILWGIAWQNLFLGVFNLLPIFPLDGGRMLLALTAPRLGINRALKLLQPINLIGCALLAVWGIVQLIGGGTGGIFTLLIAGMLYFYGAQEWQVRQHLEQYVSAEAEFYRSYAAGNTEKKSGWLADFLASFRARREQKRAVQREQLEKELDIILAKIKEEGIGKLTRAERDLLTRASKQFRREI